MEENIKILYKIESYNITLKMVHYKKKVYWSRNM